MKKTLLVSFVFAGLLFSQLGTFAQTSNIVKTDLTRAEIDQIIKKMTEHEEDFRNALNSYVFTRKATFHSIGLGGQITGIYRRDSFMTFTEDGKRFERVLFAPVSTLSGFTVTPEDIENLGGINPFALNPSQVSLYNFTFLGKEKIDELNLYVFDIAPKVIPDPKKSDQRFFLGKIWIDDVDLSIVRSNGKAVPEGKNRQGIDARYPNVDTWRVSVDGKYWFPTYSTSNDELVFSNGQVVKQNMLVTFTNYALGSSSVKVLGDEEPVNNNLTPSPTPPPVKP